MPLLFDFGSTNLSTILLEMLYRVPGIIVAISFHECAHAYAAYKCGDPTARNLGRMTLNPLAHFDPIGLVMILEGPSQCRSIRVTLKTPGRMS